MTGTGLAPTLTTLAVNTAPRRSSCPFVSGSATGASVDCRVKQGQMVPHSEQGSAARRFSGDGELAGRAKRRDELDIQPLTQQARERYTQQWGNLQTRLGDVPQVALVEADALKRSRS